MGCRETQFLPFLKDLHQPWGSDFIGENEEVGIESERYDTRVCLTMGYIPKQLFWLVVSNIFYFP